ncbi:MAG: hypothetical protein RR517_25640 [Pseudomonas sp.]
MDMQKMNKEELKDQHIASNADQQSQSTTAFRALSQEEVLLVSGGHHSSSHT